MFKTLLVLVAVAFAGWAYSVSPPSQPPRVAVARGAVVPSAEQPSPLLTAPDQPGQNALAKVSAAADEPSTGHAIVCDESGCTCTAR